MSDVALGLIVAVLFAAPLSVLLLIFADVLPMPRDDSRRRWVRGCIAAVCLPALIVLGSFVWGWAGAAHLQPLCAAYATPEFRNERLRAPTALAVDLGVGTVDTSIGPGAWPAWAAALRDSAGPVTSIERVTPGEPAQAPVRLEVRRVTHHANRWWSVQMDRFTLRDSGSGATLALADELWIDAGRARYRCGVGSGPDPVRAEDWPSGDGVARFVARGLGVKARKS